MPSIDTRIMQAIKARVSAIDLPYGVIWTGGEPSSRPDDGNQPKPYIEAHFEANRNARVFLGAKEAHERPSLLLLTLCWPMPNVGSGSGKTHPDAIYEIAASKIASHFSTDKIMTFRGTGVRVTKLPDVSPPVRGDFYLRVQTSINLETQE